MIRKYTSCDDKNDLLAINESAMNEPVVGYQGRELTNYQNSRRSVFDILLYQWVRDQKRSLLFPLCVSLCLCGKFQIKNLKFTL